MGNFCPEFFLKICLEESKFFYPDHDPQISNQIDTAGSRHPVMTSNKPFKHIRLLCLIEIY